MREILKHYDLSPLENVSFWQQHSSNFIHVHRFSSTFFYRFCIKSITLNLPHKDYLLVPLARDELKITLRVNEKLFKVNSMRLFKWWKDGKKSTN
jgi:hypothetical protein